MKCDRPGGGRAVWYEQNSRVGTLRFRVIIIIIITPEKRREFSIASEDNINKSWIVE